MALGVRDHPRPRHSVVALAVPDAAPAHRDLPDAQGRRLHDVGHSRAAGGLTRARLHVRADAPGRGGSRRRPVRRDGEGLLMARRPARPLFGYRDVGEDVRQTRGTTTRAWVILAALMLF